MRNLKKLLAAFLSIALIATFGLNTAQATAQTSKPSITSIQGEYAGAVGAGFKQIKICWSTAQGATNYQIYRSSNQNSGYSLLKTVSGEVRCFYDLSISSDITYYYKVRGYHTHTLGLIRDYSDYSNIASTIYRSVGSIAPSVTSATIMVTESLTLNAQCLSKKIPYLATCKLVKYTSSNNNICTVSGGVVTAKAVGKASITITSVENPSVKTVVSVVVTTISPLVNPSITSPYGWRSDPLGSGRKFHYGIDLYSRSDIVRAVDSGRVVEAGYKSDGGNYVAIQHSDGKVTAYFHCASIVRKSGYVSAGEQIAVMGSTGTVTGKHLHFEVRSSWGGNIYKNYTNLAFAPGDYVPVLKTLSGY